MFYFSLRGLPAAIESCLNAKGSRKIVDRVEYEVMMLWMKRLLSLKSFSKLIHHWKPGWAKGACGWSGTRFDFGKGCCCCPWSFFYNSLYKRKVTNCWMLLIQFPMFKRLSNLPVLLEWLLFKSYFPVLQKNQVIGAKSRAREKEFIARICSQKTPWYCRNRICL